MPLIQPSEKASIRQVGMLENLFEGGGVCRLSYPNAHIRREMQEVKWGPDP
jgi:hypothetical protein